MADNATLLEPRGRRLVSSIVATHAAAATQASRRSPVDLLADMPGIRSLVNRRRNSETEPQLQAPLVTVNGKRTTTSTNGRGGALIRPAASLANLRK